MQFVTLFRNVIEIHTLYAILTFITTLDLKDSYRWHANHEVYIGHERRQKWNSGDHIIRYQSNNNNILNVNEQIPVLWTTADTHIQNLSISFGLLIIIYLWPLAVVFKETNSRCCGHGELRGYQEEVVEFFASLCQFECITFCRVEVCGGQGRYAIVHRLLDATKFVAR